MLHRRAFRRAVPSARPVRTVRSILVGGFVAGALVCSAGPGLAVSAAPVNPSDSDLSGAASTQQAAANEVGRLAAQVAAADAELERLEVQAESAGVAYMAAQEALQRAAAAAAATAAQLHQAEASVTGAEHRLADFSRHTYINGGSFTSPMVLLDSRGPGEFIQRAATLDYVAANQVDVLGELQAARVRQAEADAAARAARDRTTAAKAAAAEAKQRADSQVTAQQGSVAQVAAQKAAFDKQLQAAQIQLLQLQGARDAYQQWTAQKQAEEAAAAAAAARAAQQASVSAAAARATARRGGGAGQYVLPTSGVTASCFGARWGLQHLGIDLAAPIGTPIYAVTSGVVERSGPATGFGLAVYLRGDDGAVSVYGHVNRTFVEAGDRVTAGQQIAEVGNRGQSTGPHLHFEVHPSGEMYSGAVDPAPWMSARGIGVSGC